MEELPHNPEDRSNLGPEPERLYRGEIDLTGVIRQDEALADVIGDAIAEAEDDELPAWGARTMARALANELDDPHSGALHHYAVTGRLNHEAMGRELANLYECTEDEELREWINWLGTYVTRHPDVTANTTDHADTKDVTDHGQEPDPSTPPEGLFATMRQAFAEADKQGMPISSTDARILAATLSIFLDPDSELARFADTGDANPVLLYEECQSVRQRTEHTPGIDSWITHLEQHFAARSDLGRQRQPAELDDQDEHKPQKDLTADGLDALVFGDGLDQVRAYLTMVFARADARGEPITEDSAQIIAKLLAAVLGPDSEMSRFAASAEGDPLRIQEECRQLKTQEWPTADIKTWAQRFEEYLSLSPASGAQSNLSRAPETPAVTDNPQVAQGISEHGDAFRAYLQLTDVDSTRDDLLDTFQQFYVGMYDSMDEVTSDLTKDVFTESELGQWAADGITVEEMVRAGWDIVEANGKLYVFMK